jgi:hypothetical protein
MNSTQNIDICQNKLNVGGKMITIDETILTKLNIVKISNFIDVDPYVFNYILDVMKSDIQQINHHTKSNNTLIRYGLLDKNLYIKPKIVLADPFDYNEDDKYQIIKLNLQGKKFKTFKCTIMKCPFLIKELVKVDNNCILLDKNYKAFTYILNLLRDNEICYFPKKYINELDSYEIPYNILKTNKSNKNNINFLNDTYKINNTSMKGGLLQIASNNTKIYDKDIQNTLSNFYPHSDRITNPLDKIYSHSSVDQYFNLLPTYSITHIDNNPVIEQEISIDFGKTLVFDLSNKGYGDMIDDFVIVIDLEPLHIGRWINHFGNMIIKRLYFNLNKETIINLTGEFLDIKNKLYLQNGSHYDCMNMIYSTDKEGNKISKKYNRIMLPIKLSEKIPITKENVKMLLYIELQDKNKCVILPNDYNNENNIIGGSLTNLSILTNYINLSTERSKIINNSNMYIYNNVKLISKNISIDNSENDYYLTVIPLSSFNYIKDIIIVIHSYDDIEKYNYFKYADVLLDATLVVGNDTIFKLDKMMMNKYLPLKYFNKTPDSNGIYYYSFSTNPLSNKLFGGFNVQFKKEYKTNLLIKTNKINGVIHIYSNNYFITHL